MNSAAFGAAGIPARDKRTEDAMIVGRALA
jgi:hypothetical protein